jgi:hypothetical protein
MTTVDKVLELLDDALQHSSEHGYGTDASSELCARCQKNTLAPEADLCSECRAFLLGDTDTDPKYQQFQTHVRLYTRPPWPPITRNNTLRDATWTVAPLPENPVPFVTRTISDEITWWLVDDMSGMMERLSNAITEAAQELEALLPELETPNERRRREDRERSREVVARHRRSHRRTNRWGSPP